MPLISSPVSYPPSSSPLALSEPRKRPHPPGTLPVTKKRLFGKYISGLDDTRKEHFVQVTIQQDAIPSPDSSPSRHVVDSHGPFEEDELGKEDGSTKDLLPRRHVLTEWKPPPLLNDIGEHEQLGSAITDVTTAKLTCGKKRYLRKKAAKFSLSYEQLIAQRSTTAPGKAKTSYYGIDIHKLVDEAGELKRTKKASLLEEPAKSCRPSIEVPLTTRKGRTMMWTEKYRAKKFTDLVGDERTHRAVLGWLKGWDPIVFPGTAKPKIKSRTQEGAAEERPHRKILLLTGPPGLGKTTLAHVCARQAGYEVVEINASDDRSRDIVKGRIKDCVGTENVRGINTQTINGTVRKAGRPVCVVVDEVDGVVGGSGGGGEGGFIRALIDLVLLDQKTSSSYVHSSSNAKRGKKGERFRLLRPMILICNDVYHPALRPLRASNLAELIHMRTPTLEKVVARMNSILDKEGIAHDNDGVRRLCEATWGIGPRKEGRSSSSHTGEGDIRGVLVVAEWAAGKIRAASHGGTSRLTRQWVEQHMLDSLSHLGGGTRCIGRGGAKEAVDRVFLDGAGFPLAIATIPLRADRIPTTAAGATDVNKGVAISRLRDIIDTSGDPDRVMNDVFTMYPSQPFQDDTFLTKPNTAYEWLHFHDSLSSRVYTGQEWELSPYLSQSILGFHYLFASSASARHSWISNEQKIWGAEDNDEPAPFSGPRANFACHEAEKQNFALLTSLQSSFSAPLLRSFRSVNEIATDLVPHVARMLMPDVKPVIVGGSGEVRGTASVRKDGERDMVRRAVEVMGAIGVEFERARVEDARGGYGGFVYRMEPPIDSLSTFETSSQKGTAAIHARYAVRQVLDQEYQKYVVRQRADAKQARYRLGGPLDVDKDSDPHPTGKENAVKGALDTIIHSTAHPSKTGTGVKRDFFGRVILNEAKGVGNEETKMNHHWKKVEGNRIWVTYNEGFSNAVRKPITLGELMRGL